MVGSAAIFSFEVRYLVLKARWLGFGVRCSARRWLAVLYGVQKLSYLVPFVSHSLGPT